MGTVIRDTAMREGFTRTQSAMLDVLADGMPHTRMELHACLDDELGPLSNICMHISNIRKILRPKGQDIVCELVHVTIKGGSKIQYRHVRLLASAYDGRK